MAETCACRTYERWHNCEHVKNCACYVRHLDAEAQFCLRYGAHNPSCPMYRVSLDPVDRRADDDYRARVEIAPPTTHTTIFPEPPAK